jgi:glycosyltransferase involved in cell wall biosynthesis
VSAAGPALSVVIASGAGGEFLFRCLASLAEQAARERAEVIVVDRVGGATAARVAREHPAVVLVDATGAGRPSVPELRARGVDLARGDVVCVIEEHCAAPDGWLAAIRAAFAAADARTLAVGGPILDDDFARVRDWVVYFSEYHNYLPPWEAGERYLLNGANIAYRKDALVRHRDLLERGYWEVVLHPRLAEEGRLVAVPGMGARHTGPFDFGYYLEQRYLLSRVWGGTQRERAGAAKRLAYLVLAPLFPLALLARIASRAFRSGRRVPQFLKALPLLVPVAVTYVWGEWSGYAFGVGDALERVE